jgi:hypothetical protein
MASATGRRLRGRAALLAEPLVEGAVVEEVRERVAVGEVPRGLVEAGVLQDHGRFVGHGAHEVQRRQVELHRPGAKELDQPDGVARGHQRQHHQLDVPVLAQLRGLGRVGAGSATPTGSSPLARDTARGGNQTARRPLDDARLQLRVVTPGQHAIVRSSR